MKKISLVVIAALIGGGLFFVSSCNKAKVDSNTQTASDVALCQNEFMRLVPRINSIMINSYSYNYIKSVQRTNSGPHYPEISGTDTTKYPNVWPRTLTINYGLPPGVVDSSDGKTRSGIITVTLGEYWKDYFTATINFSNYYVNGSNFSGSLNVTRTSATTFKVNGDCLCTGSGYTIYFNAGYWILTWISSVKDLKPGDSQFTLTGNGTGTDRNQVKFNYGTTSPLVIEGGCSYIASGSMSIYPAGLATRTLSFSGCSSQATVTIDGQSYNISM